MRAKPRLAQDAERFFDTAHLERNLGRRSARGGAVTLLAQGVKFILQTASTVVLARILTPGDFGLIAMVAAITGFVMLVKDLGLAQAVVQRPHISHGEVSALFWVNVGFSAALAVAMVAAAPLIAAIYDREELVGVTMAFAVVTIGAGMGTQHQALLNRQMRFTALAVTEIVSLLLASALAIVAALVGMGYWALVIQTAVQALGATILLWLMMPWRPSLPRGFAGIGSFVAFGGNLTGFNMVNYVARNADNVLIGWRWGAAPLGLYAKAYSLLMMPLKQINAPLARVGLPTLSRLAEEPTRYRTAYLRILRVMTLLSMPLVAVLIATSDLVLEVVLGEQWVDAAAIFAWLGIVGLLQPIANTTGWLFVSQGRTKEMFYWGLIGSGTSVASFVVGLPFGPAGVAAAYALTGVFVRTPILFWMVGRRGPVSTADLWRAVTVPISLAVVAGTVAFLVNSTVQGAVVPLLMSFVTAAGTVGALLFSTPAGRQVIEEIRTVLVSVRGGRPARV